MKIKYYKTEPKYINIKQQSKIVRYKPKLDKKETISKELLILVKSPILKYNKIIDFRTRPFSIPSSFSVTLN